MPVARVESSNRAESPRSGSSVRSAAVARNATSKDDFRGGLQRTPADATGPQRCRKWAAKGPTSSIILIIQVRAPASSVRVASAVSPLLLNGLQLFAGLEANGFPRRNVDFRTGAGIAADARLPRPHGEYSEAA